MIEIGLPCRVLEMLTAFPRCIDVRRAKWQPFRLSDGLFVFKIKFYKRKGHWDGPRVSNAKGFNKQQEPRYDYLQLLDLFANSAAEPALLVVIRRLDGVNMSTHVQTILARPILQETRAMISCIQFTLSGLIVLSVYSSNDHRRGIENAL